MNNKELLKFAQDNGMIDMQQLQALKNQMDRMKLLEQHPFKIYQGKDGHWYTYMPAGKGVRLKKKRNTREEIEDIVISYWEERTAKRIGELFKEYYRKKLSYGEIQNQTFDRYEADFHRYFDGSEIARKDVRQITEDELEDFIKRSIKEKGLTSKAYAGMRTILIGIFRHAKKCGLTDINIRQFFSEVEVSRRAFSKAYHEDSEQVFSDSEVARIIAYAKEHPDSQNDGIILLFQTGLRVGELSALKLSDVANGKLRVRRTEIHYKDPATRKYKFEIRESPKTDAGFRDIILNAEALEAIERIRRARPKGGYMFMRNGARIKSHSFYQRLALICHKLGMEGRSPHKARKTYCTKLIDARVDDSLIIKQMGHTAIQTSRGHYYFNNHTEDEARKAIEGALDYGI